MGGKSSSSTKQSTTQNTQQASSEGIVGGDVYQGENINIEFSDNVSKAFLEVLNLANKGIDIAAEAGGVAIESVSRREEQVSNPELATLTKLSPALMLGIAAVAVVLIFRKR